MSLDSLCRNAGARLLALLAVVLPASRSAQGEELSDPGRLLAGGYVQVQWHSDFRAGVYPRHSFELRRLRVRFQYVPSDVSASVELGCDKLRPSIEDAYVRYRVRPWLELFAGRRKLPFSREELTAASRLLMIERGMANDFFGALGLLGRDIGLTAEGDVPLRRVVLRYAVGVYNGAGRLTLDDNNAKQFAQRLTVSPAEWLTVGVSGTQRNDSLTGRRIGAYGGDVAGRFGSATVEAEVLVGNSDSDDRMLGAQIVGAYRFGAFEPALRLERCYPSMAGGAESMTELTLGGNWYLHRRAQAKVNITSDVSDFDPVVLAQMQVSF